MKVVTLVPFRNEVGCIPPLMSAAHSFSDEVLGFDDGSTDGSAELFTRLGGKLVAKGNRPERRAQGSWQLLGGEEKVRNALLIAGRKEGGTHFVVIDADEMPSVRLGSEIRHRLQNLAKGEKLAAKWILTWDKLRTYRSRKLLHEPFYKDFAFRDDGVAHYSSHSIHFGRTPGPNRPGSTRFLDTDSVLLHFQYLDFERAVLKQLWYQLIDMSLSHLGWRHVNLRYRSTFTLRPAQSGVIPDRWLDGLPTDELLAREHLTSSRIARDELKFNIMQMLNQQNLPDVEKLGIWRVPALNSLFREAIGREPAPVDVRLVEELAADLRARWIQSRNSRVGCGKTRLTFGLGPKL